MSRSLEILARWCAVVGVLVAPLSLTSCESCSFAFGPRRAFMTTRVPTGISVSAQLCVDGQAACRSMEVSEPEPGYFEFDGYVGSRAHGPVKCEYPGGFIEVTGEGCEPQRLEFALAESEGGASAIEFDVELTCDPSALEPSPGRPCEIDEVCGGQGHTCQPESGTCVPPSCAFAEDCGAPGLVCAQTTATCEASGCSCVKGEACIRQTLDALTCEQGCVPHLDDGCPEGTVCWAMSASGGYCARAGAGSLGAPCKPSDVSTGCADPLVCSDTVEGRCLRACDLFAADPGCGGGERCANELRLGHPPHTQYFLGTCQASGELAVESAALGEACDVTFARCGDDGLAVRGLCDGERCRQLCRFDQGDCPDGLACESVYSLEGFGLCV